MAAEIISLRRYREQKIEESLSLCERAEREFDLLVGRLKFKIRNGITPTPAELQAIFQGMKRLHQYRREAARAARHYRLL